jgi:hypothetical protein
MLSESRRTRLLPTNTDAVAGLLRQGSPYSPTNLMFESRKYGDSSILDGGCVPDPHFSVRLRLERSNHPAAKFRLAAKLENSSRQLREE